MKAFKRVLGIALLLLFTSSVYAQEFVSPIGFVDNEANRQKVIEYIKKQIKKDRNSEGVEVEGEEDQVALRREIKRQIEAFKEMTKVKNTKLLQSMIKSYCDMGMCNYLIILMMYTETDKTYPQTLEW